MSIWLWLSRVTALGLVGTTVLATLFFSTLGKSTLDKRNSDRIQAAEISPEEMKALELSTSSPATSIIQPNGSSVPAQRSSVPAQRSSVPPQRSMKIESAPKVQARPFDLKQNLMTYSRLFATPTSLGMVAIGVAEGNYRLIVKKGILYVQQNPSYFGHTDPGNLSWGDVVTNYGPCSDQGRSRGDIGLAERLCLERARYALPIQLVDLNAAGINTERDLEALLNVADLYNQASPIHSRHFPKALAIARRGGLTGIEAIAWARTASFYLNLNKELDVERGANQATGLLGICVRENRPITEWQCVYEDQMRRVKAIAAVVEKYRIFVQKRK